MKLQDRGILAANIYFTATCNLQCTYCYQPKICGHMGNINKKILEWISSGKMEDDIYKYYGPNVTCLSIWGGEPTLNFPTLIERLPFILERFPYMNCIDFSSNGSTKQVIDYILDLTKYLADYYKKTKRLVTLRFQFSIDGVPELNDINRIGSSADKITSNITYFLTELKNNNIPPEIFQRLSLKNTAGSYSLEYLSDPAHLEYQYRYFDDLYGEWAKIYPVFPVGGESITMVYPGHYTIEDGKKLKKIYDISMTPEFQRKFKNRNSLSFENQISSRIKSGINLLEEGISSTNKNMFIFGTSCSAGSTCLGLSYDGYFHWCHSTYFFDKEARDYIEKNNLITDFEENQGFSFRNFERYIEDVQVVPTDNELKLNRSLNIISEFKRNLPFKMEFYKMMITELANANQISPCFKEDYWKNLLITYLIYGGSSCPSNNVWGFGSVWIQETSQIKLIGNGFFEKVIDTMKKSGNL